MVYLKYSDIITTELLGNRAKDRTLQCNDIKSSRWIAQSRVSGLISELFAFWTRTLEKWIELYIDSWRFHEINLTMKLNKGVHRQIAFQQSGDVSQVISPINQR